MFYSHAALLTAARNNAVRIGIYFLLFHFLRSDFERYDEAVYASNDLFDHSGDEHKRRYGFGPFACEPSLRCGPDIFVVQPFFVRNMYVSEKSLNAIVLYPR